MGRLDIRSHLAIRHEEITDAEVEELTRPEIEVDGNGDSIWVRELPNGTIRRKKGTGGEPPDDSGRWEPAKASKRNNQIRWRELLAELKVTESEVMDRQTAVGEEITEEGRTRYESKDQPQKTKTKSHHKKGRQR